MLLMFHFLLHYDFKMETGSIAHELQINLDFSFRLFPTVQNSDAYKYTKNFIQITYDVMGEGKKVLRLP